VDELSQHCPGLALPPPGQTPASFGIKHGPPPETVITQISLGVQEVQDATETPPSGGGGPASSWHAQPPRSRVHVWPVALHIHSPLQQRSPGEQAATPGMHAAPITGSATQPASLADESDDASREPASLADESSREPASPELASIAESELESVPPHPVAVMDASPSAKLSARRWFAASTAFWKDTLIGRYLRKVRAQGTYRGIVSRGGSAMCHLVLGTAHLGHSCQPAREKGTATLGDPQTQRIAGLLVRARRGRP
jgi:hypothetical protein